MPDLIQLRRDTAANWTSVNPTLAQGEIGVETDTRKMKIGNGISAWSALGYIEGGTPEHGDLVGLSDDDHPQYLNNTRGDARYAALSHTQAISTVTGLQDALDGKQEAGSYAAATHTHTAANITDFNTAAAAVAPVQSVAGRSGIVTLAKADVGLGNVDNTSDASKPISTATQTALNGKQPLATVLTNTTAAFTTAQETKLAGIAAGATVNSADATLLARSNHTGTQAISTVTGLQTALDGKAATSHTHAIADTTGLQAALDGKQATLVSATNIKTINGTSILGSGDIEISGGGGAGDVVGPASATDGAIVRFDGTTGKLVQNSGASITDNGSLVLPENSLPTPADAGTGKLFIREAAGRLMPAFVGPSGLDSIMQPFLARNNITVLTSVGNVGSINSIGSATPTVTGFTGTARTTATTNFFTRMRKTGYVTAATAGAVGHFRFTTNTVSVGDGTGLGGFFYCIRFGISDAAEVAGARMFMGVGVATTPTNVEPSTLTSRIGIGHGASDTNFKIFYGGSAAQTPIDLGANFPCNTLSTDMYELALFAPPSVANTVHWMVTRLNTGHVASGTISGGATVLPQSNTLMAGLHGYRTNNATALAVAIDFSRYYLETDY